MKLYQNRSIIFFSSNSNGDFDLGPTILDYKLFEDNVYKNLSINKNCAKGYVVPGKDNMSMKYKE